MQKLVHRWDCGSVSLTQPLLKIQPNLSQVQECFRWNCLFLCVQNWYRWYSVGSLTLTSKQNIQLNQSSSCFLLYFPWLLFSPFGHFLTCFFPSILSFVMPVLFFFLSTYFYFLFFLCLQYHSWYVSPLFSFLWCCFSAFAAGSSFFSVYFSVHHSSSFPFFLSSFLPCILSFLSLFFPLLCPDVFFTSLIV